MSEHIVSKSTYFVIFAALILLTALTYGVALLDLGRFNAIVALTIAVIKAMLVVLFFMHLRYSSRLTWIFVGAGLFWLLIMIVLTLSDFLTRGWVNQVARL
jgi:cytochrome c oxidase subunit 4